MTDSANKIGIDRLLIFYFSLWIIGGLSIIFEIELGFLTFLIGMAIYWTAVFACYQIAKVKDREAILWGIAGLIFGPLAVLSIVLRGVKIHNSDRPSERTTGSRWVPVAIFAGLIWGYLVLRLFYGS
jgi:hypothetical protein